MAPKHKILICKFGAAGGYINTEAGFTRSIHNLENFLFSYPSSLSRQVYEKMQNEYSQRMGCKAEEEIVINSHLGKFAIVTVARINNIEELEQDLLKANMHFSELSSGKTNQTELVALLITQGKGFCRRH